MIIEDAGRVRDALGVALPVGVPEAFTEPVADPLGDLLTRYARTHGPFPAAEAAARFGLGVAVVTGVLDRMAGAGRLVRGELRPGGTHTEYCDADVLRRLRRASLAKLRAEVEPVEPAALGRFLPSWHGVGSRLRSAPTADDVLSVVEQLAGAPLPASALESLILPSRLPGYSPALLDELTAAGEVTWSGCGALAGGDGWIALAPTDVADLLLPERGGVGPGLAAARRRPVRVGRWRAVLPPAGGPRGAVLLDGGAEAPTDAGCRCGAVGPGVGRAGHQRHAGAAAGAGVRPRRGAQAAPLHPARPLRAAARRPPGDALRTGPPTVAGRWSLAAAREPDPTRRAHARAEAFLERHGVLTRGALDTERVTGGFSGVYKVLRAMEESGQVVRGYVVEGLGAAQFAARGAVDRLRALSRSDGDAGRRTRRPWSWPRPTRPSRTARRCPGRTRSATASTARPARPARWRSWSTASRRCTSSAAAGPCCPSPRTTRPARRGGGPVPGGPRGLAGPAGGPTRRRRGRADLAPGRRAAGRGFPRHPEGPAPTRVTATAVVFYVTGIRSTAWTHVGAVDQPVRELSTSHSPRTMRESACRTSCSLVQAAHAGTSRHRSPFEEPVLRSVCAALVTVAVAGLVLAGPGAAAETAPAAEPVPAELRPRRPTRRSRRCGCSTRGPARRSGPVAWSR